MTSNVSRHPQIRTPALDFQSQQRRNQQLLQQQQQNYGFASPMPAPTARRKLSGHEYSTISRNQPFLDSSRQYTALPIQRINPLIANAPPNQGPDPSEYMLRRKTPNGTLSAAYDGTPVEWATKQHAVKHILLPVAAAAGQMQVAAGEMLGNEYNMIPTGSPMADASLFRFGQPATHISTGLAAEQGPVRYGVDGQANHLAGPSNQFLGIDSVLNQTPLHHGQQYIAPSGMQVPTAIQPSNQTFPGPTASNDGGPYGPYWPNGAYIPYRPAALQDPRYHIQHIRQFNGNLPQFPHFSSHAPNFETDATIPFQTDQRSIIKQLDGNFQPGLQSFGPSTFHALPPQHPRPSLTERPLTAIRIPSSNVMSPTSNSAIDSTSPILTRPIPPSGLSRSESEQFKEKVLSWAHSVYVHLLLSIHQSRRHGHQNRQGDSQQSTRTSIYPKPPRQPNSQFYADPETSQRNRSQRDDDSAPAFPQRFGVPVKHGQPNFVEDGKATIRRSDSKSVQLLQQPTLVAVPSPQALKEQEQNRRADAKAALDMLADVCEKGGWEWIDGLLLGGCLAYGLANHSKALQWYSRILELDKNHVEATSNLAATLLSLNRREEAERYWLRSVKLRPSYFEAVEHLIGLLCGDHRGKEALSIIEYVEQSLRISDHGSIFKPGECLSEDESERSRASSTATMESNERISYDYEHDDNQTSLNGPQSGSQNGFGSSGYAIPGSENGRILALIHAKGNMMYALGDNIGAAKAFEDAILIVTGRRSAGISGLISRILSVVSGEGTESRYTGIPSQNQDPILLPPKKAAQTARLLFPSRGELPGLVDIRENKAKKAAISTTSNSLLSLAKIFQDAMASSNGSSTVPRPTSGVRDILALYYLSLSLQPSPSTANNVGILLASVQQSSIPKSIASANTDLPISVPGVVPGSGVALALAYYHYGLELDPRHAHLYTNLGSLLKDIGHLGSAINMYERAVSWDGNFDIALANLANAVKDQGRVSDAINYYKRAVATNPDFPEAVCGLANALNSVCSWIGRGGIIFNDQRRDRWHVDDRGMLVDSRKSGTGQGWIKRVVEIVERQLRDGELWGKGALGEDTIHKLVVFAERAELTRMTAERKASLEANLREWRGKPYEGAKVVRLVERLSKRLTWRWYQDLYRLKQHIKIDFYQRPKFPSSLSIPVAPTVLPFHTFTCPLSAKQIRNISQRNGLRISCTSLRSPWLPGTVFRPPSPPAPILNVGYVSSDFNNHPLAHLMQSVFGFHDRRKVMAFCYATTASDNSMHRKQIEKETPVFHDASSWTADRLIKQILQDNIHILVNLNGYTRGAKNEVFAARAVPIQMSFMGFAGTLGSEWCDYILADDTAIPPSTLRPWRRNIDVEDQIKDENLSQDESDWVYSENIVFARDTFFCCDHRQSAPDSQGKQLTWDEEQSRRWEMRKKLFPMLSDDAIILGNFNQLYKIEPTTFRTWLRILSRIPNAILWLLRFPELGESNLKETAKLWAGQEVAARIIFTDVAPKHQHISRARVCDLFLDTPECNAHTTAADVLWSGTPLLTYPRYEYKMCSRMAASILKGALPKTSQGKAAAKDLIASSDEEYEELAVKLASGLSYPSTGASPASSAALAGGGFGRVEKGSSGTRTAAGKGTGRLMELRKILYEGRWSSALFDTRRWVADLETAYGLAWKKWVADEGGDIWL